MKCSTKKARFFLANAGSVAILFAIGAGLLSLGSPMAVGDGVGSCLGGTGTTVTGVCMPDQNPSGCNMPLNDCIVEDSFTCDPALKSQSKKVFGAIIPGTCQAGALGGECTDCDQFICAEGFKYIDDDCDVFYCGFSRLIEDSCKPMIIQTGS